MKGCHHSIWGRMRVTGLHGTDSWTCLVAQSHTATLQDTECSYISQGASTRCACSVGLFLGLRKDECSLTVSVLSAPGLRSMLVPSPWPRPIEKALSSVECEGFSWGTSEGAFKFILAYLFTYTFIYFSLLERCTSIEVRGHTCESRFSPSICGSQESNSGCQAWWEVLLPNEPFHQPWAL